MIGLIKKLIRKIKEDREDRKNWDMKMNEPITFQVVKSPKSGTQSKMEA